MLADAPVEVVEVVEVVEGVEFMSASGANRVYTGSMSWAAVFLVRYWISQRSIGSSRQSASKNRWGLKQNTDMKSNTLSHEKHLAGLAVVVATGLAGLLVLPRTVTDMDGAEFALIAARGGIAHPPGYPLYSAMLRGWHEVFAGRFASGNEVTSPGVLAILSVTLSMATAWLIWAGISTWQNRPGAPERPSAASPWLAAAATVAVMVAAPVWRASTGLEPFALNDLMAAGLIFLAARVLSSPAPPREIHATLTGLIFGLALCNHHSLAFAAPLALPLFTRGQMRPMLRGAAGGFIAGLLPMLWFAVERQASPGFIWGDWSDFMPALENHVLRRSYGTLSLKINSLGTWFDGPAFMAQVYTRGLSWFWLLSAAFGTFVAATKKHRFDGLCLTGFATTGIAMPILFRMEPTGDGPEIMARFGALPLLLLAPLIGSGLVALHNQIHPRWRKGAGAALIAILVLHATIQLPSSNRGLETISNTHLEASIAATNAIADGPTGRAPWIVTNSDLDFFGFAYKTTGMTPRPVIIQSGLWPSLWYRRQTLLELVKSGVEIPKATMDTLAEAVTVEESFVGLSEIINQAKAKDAIFLSTGSFPGLDRLAADSYPTGSFIRLTAKGATDFPPHRELVKQNRRLVQPILNALAGTGCCRTAWESFSLDGWRRTWAALASTSQATGDLPSLNICTDVLAKLGPSISGGPRQIP